MEHPPNARARAPVSGGFRAAGATMRGFAVVAALALLAGCQRLPDCVPKAAKATGAKPAGAAGRPKPPPAQELLIGIDGSASMLGHTRTANPNQWETMLQAIKNAATTSSGLSVRTFRIGGGNAKELANTTASAAKNPCFFQGCGNYASVTSSLQTLWQVPSKGATIPLRLLVSDLEVNDNDISSLTNSIEADIKKGASVGIQALKLPFTGDVFNAKAKIIFSGSLNRPVYLLATGEASQVNALLNSIREKMSLSGVTTQELSLIDAQEQPQTLLAKHVDFIPQGPHQGFSPGSLRLQGLTFKQAINHDYAFALIAHGTKSIQMASINPWSGGTQPRDYMLTRLERIPLNQQDNASSGGIRISELSFTGTQLRMALTIPKDVQPGAIRATIPAGSLPQPWWITWNRDPPEAADAKEKTDGLLGLLIKLSQEVRDVPNAPPAAAFCLAFDFERTKTTP